MVLLSASLFFTSTQAFTGEVLFYPHLPPVTMLTALAAKRPGRPTSRTCVGIDETLPDTTHALAVIRTLHDSPVSRLSRRPGTHLPEPCTVTPLPMGPFQATGLGRSPDSTGIQTHKRTKTLSSPSSLHRARTKNRAQEPRRPPRPAEVKVRGKVRAGACSYSVALRRRQAIRCRARAILTMTVKGVEALAGITRAGGLPNLNRRRGLRPLRLD